MLFLNFEGISPFNNVGYVHGSTQLRATGSFSLSLAAGAQMEASQRWGSCRTLYYSPAAIIHVFYCSCPLLVFLFSILLSHCL
jgi:hypothetical protein